MRRGVGRAIADVLADATAGYGLPGVADSVHALDEASLAAAARLGYEVVGHHRESVLDLDTLDEAAASVQRGAGRAGRVRAAPAAATTPTRRPGARSTTSRSRPGRTRRTPRAATSSCPYSVFRGFLPDPSYVLMAWRDGRLVGMTR